MVRVLSLFFLVPALTLLSQVISRRVGPINILLVHELFLISSITFLALASAAYGLRAAGR